MPTSSPKMERFGHHWRNCCFLGVLTSWQTQNFILMAVEHGGGCPRRVRLQGRKPFSAVAMCLFALCFKPAALRCHVFHRPGVGFLHVHRHAPFPESGQELSLHCWAQREALLAFNSALRGSVWTRKGLPGCVHSPFFVLCSHSNSIIPVAVLPVHVSERFVLKRGSHLP